MKIKSERISLLQAIIINGGAKYLTTAITLLITMVLSRLLTPENFGMISVITVFTTFFNTISDLGLSPAMIQFQGLREEEINDIYSFSVYIGFLFAFLFCFLSIPIVWFYQNEAYISICCILSIAVLFATLNAVPNALLLKEKKFLLIGIRSIVVAVTSGVISIWLAFIGFQYYALIMQMILLRIFTYLWNMKSNRLKFKFRFSKSSLSIIWKYSSYQFLFNFINFFTRNFDNLIVGKVFGSTNLAYYDKSYTLMVYPIQAVTGIITPVLHPVLVQYKQFSAILYKQYKILVSVLLIPGIFLSVFCYWSCREIILFLFGGQWEGAVNSFALLSLSIWVQLLITSTGTIFQVVNHTRLLFVNGIINMVCVK